MTFDETIAALRAGKCVSRPNENSYLVIERKNLVKRYKEARRNHPLAPGERVDKGIGI